MESESKDDYFSRIDDYIIDYIATLNTADFSEIRCSQPNV